MGIDGLNILEEEDPLFVDDSLVGQIEIMCDLRSFFELIFILDDLDGEITSINYHLFLSVFFELTQQVLIKNKRYGNNSF